MLILWCGWCHPSQATQDLCPVLRAANDVPESDKTGCFVVVLRKETNDSIFEAIQSKLLNLSSTSRLYGSVKNVAKAITVALNESCLSMVSSME